MHQPSTFELLVSLVTLVVTLVSMWMIFEKAGRKGWESIIPIYNILILIKIIGKPWWWIILFLIPIVNIVFAVWAINLLSKAFGQSALFTLGLILLPYIFYPILAFGDYSYTKSA